MPLVYAAGAHGEQRSATERQRKARKIKPQYSEGALVKVARVANQVEAEFIAGLLLEEGIPCLLRSAIAGYAPVTGWRDVLVPESGAEAARETLAWERP
jgi:Putative prokaryotic signal transducing protein